LTKNIYFVRISKIKDIPPRIITVKNLQERIYLGTTERLYTKNEKKTRGSF